MRKSIARIRAYKLRILLTLPRNSSFQSVALDFVTYAELLVFIVAFHIFRISRIKWLPFVLFGFGMRVANSHSKFS